MKASIIIPNYNAERTIGKLLDSIISQNLKGFEVIVVDDCSTDFSKEIIKKYPVKLIELEKNAGAANARNIGVENAKSNLILFFDSDVVLEKGYLEEAIRSLKDKECVVGVYSKEPANPGKFQKFKAIMEYFWIKDLNDCSYFMPACGAVTKKLFNKAGGFSTYYKGADIEDFEFGYRISKTTKIYLNKSMQVKHNFPNFRKCVKDYYKRCRMWVRLFLKRKKFDNFGSTKGGAISSLSCFFALLFLPLILLNKMFILLPAILLLIYLLLNSKMFFYIRKEKGFIFSLYSISTFYTLSLVVSISAISELLAVIFSKN